MKWLNAFGKSLLDLGASVLQWPDSVSTRRRHDRKRKATTDLIRGFEAGEYGTTKISSETASVAIAFLEQVPDEIEWPTLAVEEDDCLSLLWDRSYSPLLVSIEGRSIHFIPNVGTKLATYPAAFQFHEQTIRRLLRDHLEPDAAEKDRAAIASDWANVMGDLNRVIDRHQELNKRK